MTKYFMKGTEDEVNFGDNIILNLKREGKKGVEHMQYECKFTPLMVPILLEEEVIEEREVEEEEVLKEMLAQEERPFLTLLDTTEKLLHVVEKMENQMQDFDLRLQKLEQDSAKVKKAVFAKKK